MDTRTVELYNNLRTMEARIRNFKELCPTENISSKEEKLGSYIEQYKKPLDQLFKLLEVS